MEYSLLNPICSDIRSHYNFRFTKESWIKKSSSSKQLRLKVLYCSSLTCKRWIMNDIYDNSEDKPCMLSVHLGIELTVLYLYMQKWILKTAFTIQPPWEDPSKEMSSHNNAHPIVSVAYQTTNNDMSQLQTGSSISQQLLQCLVSHKTNTYTRHHLVVFWQNPPIQSTKAFIPDYLPKYTKKACCIDTSPATCPFQLLTAPHKINWKCSCKLWWRKMNRHSCNWVLIELKFVCYTYQGHETSLGLMVDNLIFSTQTKYWSSSNMKVHKWETAIIIPEPYYEVNKLSKRPHIWIIMFRVHVASKSINFFLIVQKNITKERGNSNTKVVHNQFSTAVIYKLL